jgi:hypothetical protein
MTKDGAHPFSARLTELDFGRMVYHVVFIPDSVRRKLSTAPRARVIGTVNGVPFRGGVLPAGGGRHYLLLSKRFLKSSGGSVGDLMKVCLSLDDPDGVVLLPEFERALNANPTA